MTRQRTFDLIVSVSALLIAILAWQYRLRFPFDDTFITFRYADHLASGHGLVWNIGAPHTEGYTNFLFVALLAVCRLFTTDLLTAAQATGVIATVITAHTLNRTACTLRNANAGLVCAAIYLLAPLTWINALSGMETSLFVMLMVLSLWAYSRGSLFLAYAFTTLATLTRPEGALLGALFLFINFFQSKRQPLVPFIAAFVIPLIAYAIWKYCYFGFLLPNSFYIKVSESSKLLPGLQYVRLFVMSAIVLIVATMGIKSYRAHAVLVIAGLFAFSLIVFYLFVTPLEGLYDRFLWPAFSALCLTSAIGLHDIASRLKVRALPWGILLLSVTVMSRSPRTRQSLVAHEDVWDTSMDKIASSLRALPNSSNLMLAYGDAGYVVYKSGLKHLDLFGLNTTAIAHARSPQDRAAVIRKEQPDLLLLPVRDSSGCKVFVEDAYGVAHDTNYNPLASCNVFPYQLVLLVNSVSARKNDIHRSIDNQITHGSAIWRQAPSLCR
jgi:arabinofuranosyltransferase